MFLKSIIKHIPKVRIQLESYLHVFAFQFHIHFPKFCILKVLNYLSQIIS